MNTFDLQMIFEEVPLENLIDSAQKFCSVRGVTCIINVFSVSEKYTKDCLEKLELLIPHSEQILELMYVDKENNTYFYVFVTS